MKSFLNFLLTFALLLTGGRLHANLIFADFETTKGNFTMSLDFQESPLAVANFILLAGKPDDVYETPAGNTYFLEQAPHYRLFYRTTAESDVQRLDLQVAFIPQTSTMRAFYAIFQGNLYIGGVEQFSTGFHADITGEDRIRLQQIGGPQSAKYRITLRYPKTWLDASDLTVKSAPMYRAMKIRRVDTGRKFFAGGMTDNTFEHPGYHFQDEIFRNSSNYHGFPFNIGGVLAMEGGRLPNQNGSRFFITSEPDPSLNGNYTAIGRYADIPSLNVIRGIANTPSDSNQLPDEEMFILGITFRRSGLLANAFMESYWRTFLPGNTTELPLAIDRTGGAFDLVTPLRPQSQNSLYTSFDLINFDGGGITSQAPSATEPLRTDLTLTATFAPKIFIRTFSTDLPIWPSTEIDLKNARLTLEANSENDFGTLILDFGDGGTSGTYTMNMTILQEPTALNPEAFTRRSQGSGTFSVNYSSSGPYLGILNFTNSTGPLNTDKLTLHFDSSRFTYNPNFPPSGLVMRFESESRTTGPEMRFLSYSGLFRKSP